MKKFLVALAVGDLMEPTNYNYSNYQIIEAETPEEACRIYNEKNTCFELYGRCLGEYDENTETVTVPITTFISKRKK